MFESLSPRWRVVLRGLAAGAVYSLAFWVLVRYYFTRTDIESFSSVPFYATPAVCFVLCCFLLQFRPEKPVRSYLVAVFSSLAVNVFLLFLSGRSTTLSLFLFGPDGFSNGLLLLPVIQCLIVAKGLTGIFLLLFRLIGRLSRKPEADGDDTGPAAM